MQQRIPGNKERRALVLMDVKQNQFCGAEQYSETYNYEDGHHVHVLDVIQFLLWIITCML